MFTAVRFTLSGCMGVWKKLLVMLIEADKVPLPQLARILEMHSSRKPSVIVLLFNCQ